MSGLQANRATIALFVGGLVGGLLVAIWSVVEFAMSFPRPGGAFVPDPAAMVGWGLVSFIVATMVFTFGLLLVGLPGWAVLHGRGYRGPIAGVSWGVLATFLVTVVADLTFYREVFLETGDILLATSGGVVGFVIQRIAYPRGVKPPPAPSSGAPTP